MTRQHEPLWKPEVKSGAPESTLNIVHSLNWKVNRRVIQIQGYEQKLNDCK